MVNGRFRSGSARLAAAIVMNGEHRCLVTVHVDSKTQQTAVSGPDQQRPSRLFKLLQWECYTRPARPAGVGEKSVERMTQKSCNKIKKRNIFLTSFFYLPRDKG